MIGFIKLHRQILDWEWYSDTNTTRLFIHLLLKASYQDKKWQGITIKAGSLVTSLESLSKETGLSIQNIRTCLSRLKKSKELTIKTTNKFRVISIACFETYQSNNNQVTSNQQTNSSQITNKQQIDNSQLTTSKEVKEGLLEKDNLKVIQKEKPPTRATSFKALRDENDYAIIPDEYYNYAIQQKLTEEDINHEFNKFANHYESASGATSRKKNWYRTWQNWLANSYSLNGRSNGKTNNSTITAIGKVTNKLYQYPNASTARPKTAFPNL